LMGRMKGESARIEASIKGDVQLKAAEGLLKDRKTFSKKIGA
jgi:hypothetical protein